MGRLGRRDRWSVTLFAWVLLVTGSLGFISPSGSVSGYASHNPILIVGNSGFTADNGVTGGAGTPSSPYSIQGWSIDVGGGRAIDIRQTDAYFVIGDVQLYSTAPPSQDRRGIVLDAVSNGRVDRATISRTTMAVFVNDSARISITNSTLSGNRDGLEAVHGTDLLVEANNISGNIEGAVTMFSVSNVRVAANHISNNTDTGVTIQEASNISILRNDILGNWDRSGIGPGWGVRLASVSGAAIIGNLFRENGLSLDFMFSPKNITIQDNTLVSNRAGITGAALIDNMTISNNQIHYNDDTGIYVAGSNLAITDNAISHNAGSGIGITYAKHARIENNAVASNGGYGIFLYSVESATIASNELTENSLYLYGDSVRHFNSHTITDNFVNGLPVEYDRDCNGLVVDGANIGELIVANCANVRISNLHIRPMEIGILMGFVRDVTFSRSKIAGSYWAGVEMWYSTNVTIADSDISTNAFYGILAWYSAKVTIARNNVSFNGQVGVSLPSTDDVSIVANNISDNGLGVNLGETREASIAANNISHNREGVYACCSDIRVVANNIASNTRIGLWVDINNGSVYHNNFLNNPYQATNYLHLRDSFDDGYPSGGNYWSDYTGDDVCNGPAQDRCPGPDGIGDTAYDVPGGGQDRFPLMNPYGAPNWAPGASFTITPAAGTVATIFALDASSSWDREDPVAELEVRWDWQDDGIWNTPWSANKTAQHEYAAPGTYVIRLAVRDTAGLYDEVLESVVVVAPLRFQLVAVPPEGEAPLSVSFSAVVVGGLPPYSYEWSLGVGSTGSSPDLTHTYENEGTYAATLVVTDALGTQFSDVISVRVSSPVSIELSADATTGSVPLTVAFVGWPSGGTPPYSLAWDFGDGSVGSGERQAHTYYHSGEFTVSVVVVDSTAHRSIKTLQITALIGNVFGLSDGSVLVLVSSIDLFTAVIVSIVVWRARRSRPSLHHRVRTVTRRSP